MRDRIVLSLASFVLLAASRDSQKGLNLIITTGRSVLDMDQRMQNGTASVREVKRYRDFFERYLQEKDSRWDG